MSVQAISAALTLQKVTPSEKLLLIVLANYADERMKCWPSQATLAKGTCMTDRGIRKLFVSLEAKGLVKRDKRWNFKGATSDMISLYLVPEPRSATTPREPEPDSGTPGTPFRYPPEPGSANPSIEPSKEPSARARPSNAESTASRACRKCHLSLRGTAYLQCTDPACPAVDGAVCVAHDGIKR